jgi:hypothetical protein
LVVITSYIMGQREYVARESKLVEALLAGFFKNDFK